MFLDLCKFAPPKSNIDTKNDGLENVSPGVILGIYVRFQRGMRRVVEDPWSLICFTWQMGHLEVEILNLESIILGWTNPLNFGGDAYSFLVLYPVPETNNESMIHFLDWRPLHVSSGYV